MVKLNLLVADAYNQTKFFQGARLKTAELYKNLLSDITKNSVSLDELLELANNVNSDKDTKSDLLKMVEYNFNNLKNAELVEKLMQEFNVTNDLKPLVEVV